VVTSQTAAAPQSAPSGISGVLAVMKRWRWMLLAATLAAGLAGYATASRGEPEYESSAVLLVGPLSSNNDTLTAAGQLAQTYAELATTRPVLDAVARRVRVREIRTGVDANASALTRLLTVRVRQNDPRLAAAIANAEAAELIAVAERRRGLSPGAGRLRVVEAATPNLSPTGPEPAAIALLAATVGLLAALALALLLDRSADTVKTPYDLEAITGVPCVGSLSRGALRRSRSEVSVVAAEPRSRAADEYRLLAAKLSASGQRSLLVMALDGDSAVMTHNLAAALAAAGSQVAIIDVSATHEHPTAPEEEDDDIVDLESEPEPDRRPGSRANGTRRLSAVINGHVDDAYDPDEPDEPLGLEEVHTGAIVAARRSGPAGPRALLEELKRDSDLVLIHAPPLQHSPDGLAWARAAEGTVLLAQRDRTVARDLRGATETLQLVQARLVGTVLAEPPAMLRR
jgi:capsular polysaccharide biosynthesis protein